MVIDPRFGHADQLRDAARVEERAAVRLVCSRGLHVRVCKERRFKRGEGSEGASVKCQGSRPVETSGQLRLLREVVERR